MPSLYPLDFNRLLPFLSGMLCLWLCGCHHPAPATQKSSTLTDEAIHSLENLHQVAPDVYTGSEPLSERDFSALRQMGVRTVVSVDGATPKVSMAKQHGLRYVHIPIGYDGIHEAAALSLVRLMREVEGPVYFHCHHGRHRGPAAAALACLAAGKVDRNGAIEMLQLAGTSKDYAGLWRDVTTFVPPSPSMPLPALHEVASVGDLAAAMAKMDRVHDRIQLCQQAKWQTPPNHPDLEPHQELIHLKELFQESLRLLSADRDPEFRLLINQTLQELRGMEQAMQLEDSEAITHGFEAVQSLCKQGHRRFRL